MIADRRAFILAETKISRPPHVPEIELHLASEAVPLWQRTEEELGELGLPPPFWAFAWAGGQALARYVLDHPEVVRGRSVLDFATGSGIVAIAAAMAGADHVVAIDIDAFAIQASQLNAALNGVTVKLRLEDIIGESVVQDVVLAGDICYDRDIAARLAAWFEELAKAGKTILIGDPGRAYLPKSRLDLLATYRVPVTRDLEDAEVKQSSVWRFT